MILAPETPITFTDALWHGDRIDAGNFATLTDAGMELPATLWRWVTRDVSGTRLRAAYTSGPDTTDLDGIAIAGVDCSVVLQQALIHDPGWATLAYSDGWIAAMLNLVADSANLIPTEVRRCPPTASSDLTFRWRDTDTGIVAWTGRGLLDPSQFTRVNHPAFQPKRCGELIYLRIGNDERTP